MMLEHAKGFVVVTYVSIYGIYICSNICTWRYCRLFSGCAQLSGRHCGALAVLRHIAMSSSQSIRTMQKPTGFSRLGLKNDHRVEYLPSFTISPRRTLYSFYLPMPFAISAQQMILCSAFVRPLCVTSYGLRVPRNAYERCAYLKYCHKRALQLTQAAALL